MKLTVRQREALKNLARADGSAYSLRVGLNTLNALALKGLVARVRAPGDMTFPHNAVWHITDAGRSALSEAEEG